VIEELTGTINVLKYKKNKLAPGQRIFTNAKGDSSFPGSAHILLSPDGRFLYTSNRAEQNKINTYDLQGDDNHLYKSQSSLGRGPRHFSIDPSGNWLICGNQNSDEIVIFKRDSTTGVLTDSQKRISLGKPVCIKWINLN
jgi:6-phosphogluconolactonase